MTYNTKQKPISQNYKYYLLSTLECKFDDVVGLGFPYFWEIAFLVLF